METNYNVIYQCYKCGKVEHRSVAEQEFECKCGGFLRSKFTSLCSYCGEIYYKPTKQCKCGNTLLIQYCEDDPDADVSLFKEILSCIDNSITTAFDCKCGNSYSVYRTSLDYALCVCCGELMTLSLSSLKEHRKKKGWSQRLMAADIGISLKSYAGIENGKVSPGDRIRSKCVELLISLRNGSDINFLPDWNQ